MTKEQAIEVLHELDGSLYETQQVALDMAIKALEIVEELQKLEQIEQIVNNYDGSMYSMIKQFNEIQKVLEQE